MVITPIFAVNICRRGISLRRIALAPVAGDAVRRVRFAFKLAPVGRAALGALVMPCEHWGGLIGFFLGFLTH